MNRRALVLVLICGAFAATGVALPMVLGQDPAHAGTIEALHAVGGLGFVGALLALVALAGGSAPAGEAVAATPAPRTLDQDVLGFAAETQSLESRIEAAAEASKRHGRTIGVIHYDIAAYRQIAQAEGAAEAERLVEAAVSAMRPRLRNTDRVERLGKGRIAVVIVLLPDKTALESIRARLDKAVLALRPGADMPLDVGLSIYPLGGYAGEDLLASARLDSEAERDARLRQAARERRAAAHAQTPRAISP
ncbi:MAG: GGDEF domain-containing protein [Hyphomicrobiales bacterium]|nr:GGDEF domain-containing protein [Hyphomicrobiales bacterium]